MLAMLQAELRDKISDRRLANERLEDVLTSNVFGTLLYAGRFDLMRDWLGTARTLDDGVLATRLPAGEVTGELHFWPWAPGEARHGREPDALLVLRGDGGTATLLIEAKYFAGIGWSVDETDLATAGEPVVIDQLQAEYALLETRATLLDRRSGSPIIWPNDGARALVLVSAHACRPDHLLTSSLAGASATMREDLFWVSWRSLVDLLPAGPLPSAGSARALHDLATLLRGKGLRPARFFRDPPSPPPAVQPVFYERRDARRALFSAAPPPIVTGAPVFWRRGSCP